MSTTNTFAETPPRRPGLQDLGGGEKVNDELLGAPDPVRDATADDFNQMSMQLAALLRSAPLVTLTLRWTGTVHVVDYLSSLLPGLTLATVSSYLLLTPNGAGDLSVTWLTSAFPTRVSGHRASVLGATPMQLACETLANGLRVRTRADTTPTHTSLLIEIF